MSYQEGALRALTVLVCDKTAGSEVSLEYVLPDYEEEIKKLLKVKVRLLPPASYVGGGDASFSGTVCFDLLYSSPEGKLCATTVQENYELSAPILKDADIDLSDGIFGCCDVWPESTVSRVLAPRKVSLKCRLRAMVRAYGKRTLSERMTGEFSPEGIERLAGMASCATFAMGEGEFDVDGETEVPMKGEWSVIGCGGEVRMTEVQCGEGEVLCRGELFVSVLVTGEDGKPHAVQTRIPFSERIEGDGFTGGMGCHVWGAPSDLSAEAADGKMSIRGSVRLSVTGQGNGEIPYTKDLYSSARVTQNQYQKIAFPHAAVSRHGNFTQSLYEAASDYGLPKDAEIIDLWAAASVSDCLCDRGKWALVGETCMTLLMTSEGEYKCVDIPVPFRYEFEGECGTPESFFARVSMTGGRARVEGDRLAIECEMGVSVRVCTAMDITALCEAEFGERVEEDDECVVCFPSKGDSLWEIAKRYHVPMAALRARNGLKDNDETAEFLVIKG